MSTLAGWLDAIANSPDLRAGNCIGDWVTFDNTDDPLVVEACLERCASCSVLQRCRDYVNQMPATKRPVGVVAGEVRRAPQPRKRADQDQGTSGPIKIEVRR